MLLVMCSLWNLNNVVMREFILDKNTLDIHSQILWRSTGFSRILFPDIFPVGSFIADEILAKTWRMFAHWLSGNTKLIGKNLILCVGIQNLNPRGATLLFQVHGSGEIVDLHRLRPPKLKELDRVTQIII